MADVRREAVERAVRRGTAPFIGIPVESAMYRTTAVIRRDHAKTALSCPGIRRVYFDVWENALVFNGGKNRYALLSQRRRNGVLHYEIRRLMQRWADAARLRKPKAVKVVGRAPEAIRLRREERIERQIAKFEKRRADWRTELAEREELAAVIVELQSELAELRATAVSNGD